MRNLLTVVFGMSLGLPFIPSAVAQQPRTWQDVDMNRPQNANYPDFGAGLPASGIDPGPASTTAALAAAIKSTQVRLQKLDEAEEVTKQYQENLAFGLTIHQKTLEGITKYASGMIAIGALAPEDFAKHAKWQTDVLREIRQEQAEMDKTLEKIKDQRAALSLQLEVMQTRLQQATASRTITGSVGSGTPGLLQQTSNCTLASRWSNQIPGIGVSNWTITDTGVAQEGGMGGATGQATLVGSTLTIEWKTAIGQEGTYVIQLNDSCTSGKGTMRQTKAPAGIKLLTGDSYFTRQ